MRAVIASIQGRPLVKKGRAKSAIFADWGIMGEGKSGVRRVPGGFV